MNDDKMILDFLSEGLIIEVGIDPSSGETLYQFTPKMQSVLPNLYKEQLNFITQQIMYFWEKGFVDVDLLSDDPVVTLAPKAFDEAEISSLSKQEKWTLLELKRMIND